MERELKGRSSSRAQVILSSLGITADQAVGEGVAQHGAHLREAAAQGDCAALRQLLCSPSRGDDEPVDHELSDAGLLEALEQKDKLGNTALMIACKGGWMDALAVLLDASADPNTANIDGVTPLHLAAGFREGNMIKYLICAGASLDVLDKWDQTPLCVAAYKKRVRPARALLQAGASPNVGRKSALYWACLEEQRPLVNRLLVQARSSGWGVKSLHLEYAGLEELPMEASYWRTFASLSLLDLRGNQLQALPPALVNLGSLSTVRLDRNPLGSIPGPFRATTLSSSMKRYLSSIERESAQWPERKLLLVGQEGVGKTTLLKSLRSAHNRTDVTKNQSTDGMTVLSGLNLEPGKVGVVSRLIKFFSPEPPYSFSAWDLGGQEVFYPTHQLFLSSQSIFLVVFNMAQPQFERIDYWMNQIRSSAATEKLSPIILVGTHADSDLCTGSHVTDVIAHVARRYPRQRFPGVLGCIPVSCKTGVGMVDLKTRLEVAAAKLSCIVSPRWVFLAKLVKDLVHRSKVQYLELPDYQDLALSRCHIPENELGLATEFLCSAGYALHFGTVDPDGTSDAAARLVVLDPQWLANVMRCFVSFKSTWAQNGVLACRTLTQVLKGFPESTHSSLLDLLEQYRIIHRLQPVRCGESVLRCLGLEEGSMHILVPSLLPEEAPVRFAQKLNLGGPSDSFEVDVDGSVTWRAHPTRQMVEHGRLFRFGFLPLGFFERLLVSTFYITAVSLKHLALWRNGCILQEANADMPVVALITYGARRRGISARIVYEISIRVRSPCVDGIYWKGDFDLLKELVRLVEHILDCFYQPILQETLRLIPCIHCIALHEIGDNLFHFTYDECVAAVAEGKGAVFCKGIRTPVRTVFLHALAPDVTFAGLGIIPERRLRDLKELGEGAFGKVWQARLQLSSGFMDEDQEGQGAAADQQLDSTRAMTVAVKELHMPVGDEDDGMSEERLRRFADFGKEVQIMTSLESQYIVNFFGITMAPLRIVMEFVPGGDLHELLRPSQALLVDGCAPFDTAERVPWQLRYRIAYDITCALEYLQSLTPPIIHRDLRSPNIFIASKDPGAPVCAKVADFGLSTLVAPEVGGLLATWQWLAPEVFDPLNKQGYDQRSDIYSLGTVLWELIDGDWPFAEYEMLPQFSSVVSGKRVPDEMALKHAVVHSGLRPSIPNTCDPRFAGLIERCWAKDPADRPSCQELRTTLEELLRNNYALQGSTNTTWQSARASCDFLAAAEVLSGPDNLHDVDVDCQSSTLSVKCDFSCMLRVGDSLWVGNDAGEIRVYDFPSLCSGTVHMLSGWQAHHNSIVRMVLVEGHSGEEVWSCSKDNTLAAWSVEDETRTWCRLVNTYIADMVTVNSARSTVWVSLPCKNGIEIINSKNRRLMASLVLDEGLPAVSMCYEARHNVVWVGTEKYMYLFNPDTRERVYCWLAHSNGNIQCLTECLGRVWSSSGNQTTVWEYLADSKQMMRHFTGKLHSHRITCMRGSDKHVWSCGYDYRILVWDGESCEVVAEIDRAEGRELARCAVPMPSGCIIGASCKPSDGIDNDGAFVGKLVVLKLKEQS